MRNLGGRSRVARTVAPTAAGPRAAAGAIGEPDVPCVGTWTPRTTNAPSGGSPAFVIIDTCEGSDGLLYFIASNNSIGTAPKFYSWNSSTDTFTLLTAPPTYSGTGTQHLGSSGGVVALSRKNPAIGETLTRRYSIGGGTWSAGAALPTTTGLASVSVGNYLYQLNSNGTGNPAHLWRYDIGGDAWTQLANAPNPIDPGQRLGVLGGNLYVFNDDGSGLGSTPSSVYKYDVGGNSWTQLASDPVGLGDGDATEYNFFGNDTLLVRRSLTGALFTPPANYTCTVELPLNDDGVLDTLAGVPIFIREGYPVNEFSTV